MPVSIACHGDRGARRTERAAAHLRGKAAWPSAQRGGVPLADAHLAEHERRFSPSAHGPPARRACREADWPRAFGQSRSPLLQLSSLLLTKAARAPLLKQASRSCFLKPLAFVRAALVAAKAARAATTTRLCQSRPPLLKPPAGDAHGHGPYPITNSERTLLSAWLKQGRDWLML